MSGTKILRVVRWPQIAALIYNLGSFVFNTLIGNMVGMILGAVCVAVLAVAVCVQTRTIRRREYLDRPRPDYAAIARMEREIYGETFKHEGAGQPARRETVRETTARWERDKEAPKLRYGYSCDCDCDEHPANLRWERRS